MEWSLYLSFVPLAMVIAFAPGPDSAVVLKNSLMIGRKGGTATALGVIAAGIIQASLAAAGLGLIIAESQPLLQAVRVLGALYLSWMAIQALRTAWRGEYDSLLADTKAGRRGFRQGFIVNITNPVLIPFFLAVFPQFMTPGMEFWGLALLAGTLPAFAMLQLLAVVGFVHMVRRWIDRRPVRRVLDAAVGGVLAFLGVRVAVEAFTEAA